LSLPTPTPPTYFDVLVTGLVIGGGTKSLHDLIARVEKSKDKAQDHKEAGA